MLFFHSRHYDSSMSKGKRKRDDEEEARENIQEKGKNNLQF